MKYRLSFRCGKEIALLAQSNKILQAAILSWLGESGYAAFLHDQGYRMENRTFKLYTFSEIQSRCFYDKTRRKLIYPEMIEFYLSFYTNDSYEIIKNNLVRDIPLRLGDEYLPIENCELILEENTDCIVRTVSPITIHSTLELPDGRKKTYYYTPWERDFSEMLRQNLVRKYRNFHGQEPKDNSFKISREGQEQSREVILHYNRFLIKGWHGTFHLHGSEEMLRMALLSGLGARNGIGMGCVIQTEVD